MYHRLHGSGAIVIIHHDKVVVSPTVTFLHPNKNEFHEAMAWILYSTVTCDQTTGTKLGNSYAMLTTFSMLLEWRLVVVGGF